MHVELVSELDSRDEFARLTGEWITGIRDLLYPGFDENQSRGLLPFSPPDPPAGYWILGRPAALKANIYIQRYPHDSLGRGATYSGRSWEKLVNGLAEAYPFRVSLLLSAVDDTGKAAGSGSSLLIGVRRDADSPGWVRFEASPPPDIVDVSGSPQLQRELVSFVREWVAKVKTCYGHVTDDADSLATALERATGRYSWDTIPRCREALRGYSWVTVCPAELAARLGGSIGLERTEAFCAVAEVAGGSVFLQATPAFDEYDGAAMRRVFEALAPVLLPGRVKEPEGGGWLGRVVTGVDAADYPTGRDL